MRRDKLRLLNRSAKPLCRLQNDKMMARTVKSIPANSVSFVVLIWNRVVKGVRRQRLVEGGIEDRHLLLVREQFRCHANALYARRIMKRREIRKLVDSLHHALGNENRPTKIFSAMDNAMSDRFDFQLFTAENLDNPQKRRAMIRSWECLVE